LKGLTPSAAAVLALLAVATPTLPAGFGSAAIHLRPAKYSAGEIQVSTDTLSAAVRNRGDGALRILVWYPAVARAEEREVDIGPPDDPMFAADRVAADAPWSDSSRHALILLSHDFGGVARQLTWLGAALARRGYIVVAVDHPGSNSRDGVTPEGTYAPWERAGDLRSALDLVLADPALSRHIDASHLGVAGFSLGGWTAALEVGARADFDQLREFCTSPQRDSLCDPQSPFAINLDERARVLAKDSMRELTAQEHGDFIDSRIRAAFLIAPVLAQALGRQSLTRIRVPVEILLGGADPVATPKTNGEWLAQTIPRGRLQVLKQVGHYDFLAECRSAGLAKARALCADGEGTHRAATHSAAIAEAVRFFDDTVR